MARSGFRVVGDLTDQYVGGDVSRETAVASTSYGAPVKRVGFRGRLFVVLLAFALIPSIVIALAWNATGAWVLPMVGSPSAWDSAAATGQRALEAAQKAPLTVEQRQAVAAHDSTLRTSLLLSRQARFLFQQASEKLT